MGYIRITVGTHSSKQGSYCPIFMEVQRQTSNQINEQGNSGNDKHGEENKTRYGTEDEWKGTSD